MNIKCFPNKVRDPDCLWMWMVVVQHIYFKSAKFDQTSESTILFHVPENRRLSDAACCHGNQSRLLCWLCQGSAPIGPRPFLSVVAHFPLGDFTHNICPVFPKARELLDRLFSIKAIHTHTHTCWEGQRSSWPVCHDLTGLPYSPPPPPPPLTQKTSVSHFSFWSHSHFYLVKEIFIGMSRDLKRSVFYKTCRQLLTAPLHVLPGCGV